MRFQLNDDQMESLASTGSPSTTFPPVGLSDNASLLTTY